MIRLKKIPEYLKKSNFLNQLEEHDFIEVPKNVFKENDNIHNFNDFNKMLKL